MAIFYSIEPTIQCSYLLRSVEFYQLLSFKLDSPLEPEHQGAWMRTGYITENHTLIHHGITIILKEVYNKISPQKFRIHVSDVKAFHSACKLSEHPSVAQITHWPHGYSCFEATDPDGHEITFYSLS